VGAGAPAKPATRCLAPASPVFAAKAAPTPTALTSSHAQYLWERASPRKRRRGGWHGLRPCSRARPLPQGSRQLL